MPQLRHTTDVRTDSDLRCAFYALTQSVFCFSLESWYTAGFWTGDYVCHALLDGDLMVANASTTRMTLHAGGRPTAATQVGTVATLPAYRKQGLARRLMEEIVEAHQHEPMFLFANDSVVDFYPQFGFQRGPLETKPIIELPHGAGVGTTAPWTRVEPSDARVLRLVEAHAVDSRRLGIRSTPIAMFHLLSIHASDVYLLHDGALLLIAKRVDDRVEVYGLFAEEAPDAERLLMALFLPGIRQLRFHFEPDAFGLPTRRLEHRPDDTHLFVNRAFPTLTGPWLFPTLAYA